MQKLKIGYIALGTEGPYKNYIAPGHSYSAGAKVYSSEGRALAAMKGRKKLFTVVPVYIDVPEDQYETIKQRNGLKD